MCTVGGGMDVGNIEALASKDYECLDCKNKFKAMGRKPSCPSCKSRNLKQVSERRSYSISSQLQRGKENSAGLRARMQLSSPGKGADILQRRMLY